MAKSNSQRRRRGRGRPARPARGSGEQRESEPVQGRNRQSADDHQSLLPRRSTGRARQSDRARRRGRSLGDGIPDEIKYRMPDAPPKREYSACPICGEPMRDIHSAIAFPPSNQPAHFECVTGRIAEQETLAENERVVYLGNGSFGIVADEKTPGVSGSRYMVRKRIQFEDKDTVFDWRKELSPGISRD